MAVMQVKDMNGKDFSFDTDKIATINGDIADSNTSSLIDLKDGQRVQTVHEVQFVNQKGETLDSVKLLSDMASGKASITAIDVEAESTHSGKNLNHFIYYEDSMEKDAESFINPFRKPMLKNHNDYSGEPIGRIRQAWLAPSELTDERSAIHTVTRVTDKDAIEKFLDGRYSTLSIGGTVGSVTCNICGKTILKDGKFKFCGHWRGETYKDQVCHWGARDITYNEHSVVNTPADVFAQVMKVTVLTDEDKNTDSKNNTQEGVNDMDGLNNNQQENTTDAKKQKLFDLIDSILSSEDKVVVTDSVEEPIVTEDKKTEEPPTEDKTTVEDMKKELEEVKQKLEDMKKELDETNKKLLDAEASKTAALEDAKNMKEQAIALAQENKSLVADSIIALEKIEDDKIEDRKKELVAMSMKELQATKDSITNGTSQKPRTPAQTQNPTLANGNEKGSTIVDSEGNPVIEAKDSKETEEDSNKKSSVQDYANEIISKLARR